MRDALIKLATDAIPVLGAFLLAVLTILLNNVRAHLKAKFKIDISDALDSELRQLARDAVTFAEESAHSAAKNGIKYDGDTKLHVALAQLKLLASKHNLDDKRLREIILVAVNNRRQFSS